MTSSLVQREPNPAGHRLDDWEQPLSSEELLRLARTLRTGVSVDDLYDIIDAAAGQPDDPAVLDMTERLRGALMQLVNAVLERDGDELGPAVAGLVEQAQTLREADSPSGGPLAHLRRLSIIAEGLLEDLLHDGRGAQA
ncbi:DUF6415 family natural product biosynthesis protein [Streptomyces sp. NPDC002073]